MILHEIAAKTKERIERAKRGCSLSDLKAQVADGSCEPRFPFEEALRKKGLRFLCEVKKASPSKGVIAGDFPYVGIAREYEEAGADAVSVLTEPFFFQGRDEYLKEIRQAVTLPLLRKDFTVDEYMIYEAKLLGADAVLLICALLSEGQLKEYLQIAQSIGLSALVEVHDEKEVEMALAASASVIGVNNRNLKDFSVDLRTSVRLRPLVPRSAVFVSESGVETARDVARLRENGADAVLIGEILMRSPDKKAKLRELGLGT
ncbi:MAG: indole-3-glycerol phosphate synthase TrpC [Clostridium sp.]|nr:indole-3-glycerol phosphate synthase TrpC [Clostridium sp.]